MRDPEMRRAAARRGRRRDRADAPVPRSRARVPVRRHARLRAGAASTASPASRARRAGREMEVFYDALMDDDGHKLVMRPLLNYTGLLARRGARDARRTRPRAWGLGDGGAHCGTTCDASTPTFMLTHWARDRAARPAAARVDREQDDRARPPRSTASATAACSQPGMLGDVNVIDFDGLQLAAARAGARPSRRRAPLRAGLERLRRDGEARHRDPARRRRPGRPPRSSCSARASAPTFAEPRDVRDSVRVGDRDDGRARARSRRSSPRTWRRRS